MSFDVQIRDSGFAAKVDDAHAAFKGRLLSVAQALDDQLVALARSKADGGVLDVKTGLFLSSIQGKVSLNGERLSAAAWSDVAYAGTIEYGATTSAHDILPTAASALAFGGDAGEVFAKVVHDPGAHIPAHSVIGAAMDEMRDTIAQQLADAAQGFGS